MKKGFFVLMTALMAATTANAQRVGLTFGMNSSKIANEDAENLIGFNGGIKADAGLADTKLGNVFVEGSLLFSRLGYHYENNIIGYTQAITDINTNVKTEYDEKYSYLQLPVNVGHNFKITDKFSVGPKAGIYFGFGLKGEKKWKISGSGENELSISSKKDDNLFKDLEDYGKDNYKRFDFGFGLGLNVDMFKNFQLGLGYSWGCVEFNENGKDYKNRNFNLNFAYMF